MKTISSKFKKLIELFIFLLLPLSITAQNNILSNTQDCSGTRPPFDFEPSLMWSAPGVSNHTTVLAGDIDGDQKVELLVTGISGNNILIFEGATGASAGTILTGQLNGDGSNPYVIVDVEGDGKAEIFVVNTSLNPATATLYTVTSAPGVRPITFGTRWSFNLPNDVRAGAGQGGAIPVVADLDGDGLPEFVVSYYIIRADGTMCPTRMNYRGGIVGPSYMCVSFVADLDGDGIPEIVVGTDVYKYNGVNATLWKRCPSFPAGKDGTNMAADINLDGHVDLVYHDNDHSSAGSIVVWTPVLAPAPGVSSTQGVIGSFPTITGYSCYPVVGDIDGIVAPDGNKYPEICYNSSNNQFIAWSFDGSNFFQKFNMPTNENSGLATFTYFDFNLDGILELVYRDEQNLRVLNAQGAMPVEIFRMPASSGTLIETPIVVDVTGDGSANIVVTGSNRIHVFEGAASKWASCPPVWNQQMYSNLLINTDLTVITNVSSAARKDEDCKSDTIRLYNGGPMQAPYVSVETFCPIDLSPDVFVIDGSITELSPTSVSISLTVGNQGIAMASSAIPIRFYENSINSGNIIPSGNITLGVDLFPGQSTVITHILTGLSPGWVAIFVRLLDDGVNFPASGAFSDCNLTNNTKSFGTLELTKEIDQLTSCIGNIREFTVKLKNDNQTQTYTNILLTDSLSVGWTFISAMPSVGTSVSAFYPATRSFEWTIPTLTPGDSAVLIIQAQVIASGSIRNYSWIESVGGVNVDKDYKSAYVIASSFMAPTPPVISPSDTVYICPPTIDTLLTASGSGVSYQWYHDGIAIPSATSNTYRADTSGVYTVTLFDGNCTSNQSDTVTVIIGNCILAVDDSVQTVRDFPVTIDVLANDNLGSCPSLIPSIVTPPVNGTATLQNDSILYIPSYNYVGNDSLTYRIVCSGDTSYAKVRIRVIDAPDNVIDVDCYVDAPSTIWDIERKAISNARVHYLATPFVGDLDGDGRLEVVAPGAQAGQDANTIVIFNDQLQLIRTISTPTTPQYNTTNLLIADVDNDGFGEIVIATSAGILICYSHLGVEKWRTTVAYNANTVATDCPSLIIADINCDGHAEILAVNNIYDAATGVLLATLPTGGRGFSGGGPQSYMSVFADIDNDGLLEVVAGNTVYKVTITNRTGTVGNSAVILAQMPPPFFDGFTSVADIDLDGDLDVIVTGLNSSNVASMYVWDGATATQIGNTVSHSGTRISRAFAGDITGTGAPDIAYTYTNRIVAYEYNKSANIFNQLWSQPTTDSSGATTMSMFDFDQDGEVELVYRDQTDLRIINKYGVDIISFPCLSATHTEYPVIVDLDKDGHADILVSGGTANTTDVYIMRYSSVTPNQWASARSVWNQHAYNAVHINEDLSIPRYQINPAIVFPNGKRPFNAFLQQQTMLNPVGDPLWRAPDADTLLSTVQTTVNGNAVTVTVEFFNFGETPLGPPVHVAIYKENLSQIYTSADTIATGSIPIAIAPGSSGQVTIVIPDITAFFPFANMVIRLNDNGLKFPFQPECDTLNNIITIPNPLLNTMVQKKAVLFIPPSDTIVHDGFYANPVAAYYDDTIEYRISAINAYLTTKNVFIRDTLPAWLDYVLNSDVPPASVFPAGNRYEIVWSFPVLSMDTLTVRVRAMPEPGVSASQPLFDNRAWVTFTDVVTNITDTILATNYTFHQGVGVSVVTFSAGYGGKIFQALEQVLDYHTSPRAGIVIVPDEGYRFAGWSQADYISLRGELISAQSGIMHYDTLIIYGNVNLQADFELEVYPITYYLNGGQFPERPNSQFSILNSPFPTSYTIESQEITLEAPEKEGDVFVGWTGSNGDEPQLTITVPHGSTGEKVFFANYLHSGREAIGLQPQITPSNDLIWAVKNELFVRTTKAGSILRIYSLDGVLLRQQTILQPGESKYKLTSGLFIITLNNSLGHKVTITE